MRRRQRADPAATDAARRRVAAVVRFGFGMAPAMVGANSLGAGVVYVYLTYLDPPGSDGRGVSDTVITIVFVSYLGAALVFGTLGTLAVLRPVLRWYRATHSPDERDRRTLLRLPVRVVRVYGALWLVGVLVFGALTLADGVLAASTIALSVALGGLTTCALSYLLTERLARALVALAMDGVTEPPPVVLGVRRRVLLSWALGTGVPLLGITAGIVEVGGEGQISPDAVLFLALLGLLVGLLSMLVTARSVSDPIEQVTGAMREVAAGRLQVSVPVYDASEIGQLQSGFNAMVSGLRERERLADLFGRQVGSDVARLALEQGADFGGRKGEVAVLFVDVVGSTGLALSAGAEQVVAQLNEFFAVVVDVVDAHGGWVNKFEGDAALCLFGAPVALPDAPACALAAARALADRLGPLPLDAAIGVSAGLVVAGHVGAATRFEYTVIGDPVNAAARLTELAKTDPTRVLADREVVAGSGAEAAAWEDAGEALLRGRDTRTLLSRPLAQPASGSG